MARGGGGGKIFKTKGYGGGGVFFNTVELRGVNFENPLFQPFCCRYADTLK